VPTSRITNAGGDDYDVLVLRGSQSVPRAYGRKLAAISRPGSVGNEYLVVGRKPESFRVRLFRDAATDSEARNLELYFKRMEGQLVTYRDERGKDWTNVLVIRVQCFRNITPGGTGFAKDPGSSERGLWINMTMELTTEPTAE
jgi:hypothetical protein